MQKQQVEDGSYSNAFTSWLLPIAIESIRSVIPQEAPQKSAGNLPHRRTQQWESFTADRMSHRQAPPPPPHEPLPEDFRVGGMPPLRNTHSQLPARAASSGSLSSSQNSQAAARLEEHLLEARKKEMQTELDHHLKQLDSERKEGLYRLDWELAEAVEALHARHAERANNVIRNHKQTITMMEERAQAGEQLTPEKVQRLRIPAQAQSPVPPPQLYDQVEEEEEEVSEESEWESEEEGQEEGVFSRFISMISGDDQPQQQVYPQHGSPEGSLHSLMMGAQGSPARINGYGGNSPTSPLAMVNHSPGLGAYTSDVSFTVSENDILLANIPSSHSIPFSNSVPALSPIGGQIWPPANVFHANQ